MSSILNLKHYDLVFTTSFENLHGISGHLYEMIDYYYVCSCAGINCAILLSDGTSKDLFKSAVTNKYTFTQSELNSMLANTIEHARPKIIMANVLCIADGSSRLNGSTVYADNVLLLRCFDKNFDYFATHNSIKHTYLLHDTTVYLDTPPVTTKHYVKKILWSKYQAPTQIDTETALMYLTTNCRQLSTDDIVKITEKYNYNNYLIVTNQPDVYQGLPDNIQVVAAPVHNIFEQFDAYIYTSTAKQFDCSPRFIVECALYNKTVHYEIDYEDLGIAARRRAIDKDINELELTVNDEFVKLVKDLV